MNNMITLELKEFPFSEKKWPVDLLRKTVYARLFSFNAKNKEDYEKKIKDNFINVFNKAILTKVANVEPVKKVLTTKIYKGSIETLLERISHSIYRKYIEEKDTEAQIIISRKILGRFNISPAKFIECTKKMALFLKEIMEIKVWHQEKKVILEFSLIL